MISYAEELNRRIGQFTKILKKMHRRAPLRLFTTFARVADRSIRRSGLLRCRLNHKFSE
jgi:hypothetical protein